MPYNPVINDGLPHFLDRADGSDYGAGPVGAPTPAKAITVQSYLEGGDPTAYQIQEDVDSPTLERAEQATITKSFHDLSWTEACTRITGLGRGGVLIDKFGNQIRILSSNIQSQRGDKATLKIIAEGLSFDTPPDEFSITPVELGINIIKHPRYYSALNPAGSGLTTIQSQILQCIIRTIQTYQDSPFFPSVANLNGLVQCNIFDTLKGGNLTYTIPNPNYEPTYTATPLLPLGTPDPPAPTANKDPNPINLMRAYSKGTSDPVVLLALAAAKEVIQKLWKIEDSPYMVGYEISWSVYYYRPYPLNPGGYVENPITKANPALPDYFYSPDNPPHSRTTIFDELAFWNPQCYSDDGTISGFPAMSCLRKADTIEYQRTWFKVTRSWLCSAIGVWDTDINSGGPRPAVPSDYKGLQ